MTVGNRTNDGRFWLPYGASQYQVGPRFYKGWSGTNGVVAGQKPTQIRRPKATSLPGYPPKPNRSRKRDPQAWKVYDAAVEKWWQDLRSGEAQARYLRRKANREKRRLLPPQDYYARFEYECKNLYLARTSVPGQVVPRTISDPWGYTYPPVDAEQHLKLIEKLRRRAYGSGFNPAVFAAEMPQALRMIASSATRIRLALIACMQGNWRGVVRNLSIPTEKLYGAARTSWLSFREGKLTLSGFWLEISYGWKPLVSDLDEACQYIAEAIYNDKPKGKGLYAMRKWEQVDYLPPAYGQIQYTKRTTSFIASYRIYATEKSARFVPSLHTVSTVAWEKLPWSFVCDWVIPIGQYLAALRTASDLKGTVVFSVLRETVFSEPRAGASLTGFAPYTQLPEYSRLVYSSRAVSTEISPPTPIPDLSPGSVFKSWQRAANAVALLAQRKWKLR
ncbi:MAG: maturation protein [Sanya fiers-like virus 39]|nr:MAG: maturation protein [Sanya fiers-like virus 39]